MPTQVHDRIVAIIAEQAMLDPADIRPDMTPAELGLSLIHISEPTRRS